MSVVVQLTVEDSQGEQRHVSAPDPDYETALAAAQALMPEGFRAIVIRVPDRGE